MTRFLTLLFSLASAALIAGCGGEDNPAGPPSTDPPVIVTQPAATTVVAGASAAFTVVASGAPTLHYQWQRNGADVAGASASSYVLANAAMADNGAAYAVVVSNAAGTATSAAATLTVTAAPAAPTAAVPAPPASASVGSSITLTATVTGSPAPTLRWSVTGGAALADGAGTGALAGSTLTGTDTASLTIANLPLSADGLHLQLLATNSAGSATSTPVILGVAAVSGTVVGAAGGEARSAGGEIRVDAAAGQLAGDTTFNLVAQPTAPLIAQLPAAIARDYAPVAGGAWQITMTGAGFVGAESLHVGILAAAPTPRTGDIASARRNARPLGTDPTTPLRAIVQCPDATLHMVTPEYSDGTESFVVNCPAFSGNGVQVLTVVLVQLTAVSPANTQWTRQVGDGALDGLASIDSSGRVSIFERPSIVDSNGAVVDDPHAPLHFKSYDSDGNLRGDALVPLPTAIGTSTPYTFDVYGFVSTGNGRHVLYGAFAATAADVSNLWIMALDESVDGASAAGATTGAHEAWSKRFGKAGSLYATTSNYSALALTADGDVLIGGVADVRGPADPVLGFTGSFLARFKPDGTLRWVAPVGIPASAGSMPVSFAQLSVGPDGNPAALVYPGGDGDGSDAAYCGGARRCLLVMGINGTSGAMNWVHPFAVANSATGLDLALDAVGRIYVAWFSRIGGPLQEGSVTRYTASGTQDYAITLAGTSAIENTIAMSVAPTGQLGLVYRGTLNLRSTDPAFPEQTGVFYQTVGETGSPSAPRNLWSEETMVAFQSRLYDRAGNAYVAFTGKVSLLGAAAHPAAGCSAVTDCYDWLVFKLP